MSPSIALSEASPTVLSDTAASVDIAGRSVRRWGQFQRDLRLGPPRQDVAGDPDFASRLGAELDRIANQGPLSLISVDVFDTVLVRDPISELHRFWNVAKLQANQLPRFLDLELTEVDLLVARLQATHASYRVSEPRNGCREGSILQIYRTVERCLGLPRGSYNLLIAAELDYETTVLQLNRPLIDWLSKQGDNSIEVVLLSDMYLHDHHIRRLLRGHGVDENFPTIISSADYKVSKHAGRIFDELLASRGATAETTMHIGDSLHSDYAQAKRAGIRSAHLPIPQAELDQIVADHMAVIDEFRNQNHDLRRWINGG